jgi:hypothetical protein
MTLHDIAVVCARKLGSIRQNGEGEGHNVPNSGEPQRQVDGQVCRFSRSNADLEKHQQLD